MTISSSLNASVAGLASNASRLATISDNIANSSTFGYKRAETDFHAMVINNSTGSYSAGGVRTTNQRLIDERGSIVSTSNATDLSVLDRGMLPVTEYSSVTAGDADDFPLLFATTGSFRPNSDGYLVTESGLALLGWPANVDGTLPSYARDSASGLEPIQLTGGQFVANPTANVELSLNLPATSTSAGADGDSEVLTIEYYDNLGIAETLSVTFVPDVAATGYSNTWTMFVEDSASGGALVGEYILEFDDTAGEGGRLMSVTNTVGGAYDGAEGTVGIAVNGGTIDINIGLLNEPGGITQLSDTFAPVSISKDGSAVGNLTSVEVDPNGFVVAFYDSGLSRTIYQIPLANVSNENGLSTSDNQSYEVTLESGEFYLWDAGDGPTGDIVSYAREESATDVAGELTQLIQTQRAYSSNAKVIQTVDEMLQETTNIIR